MSQISASVPESNEIQAYTVPLDESQYKLEAFEVEFLCSQIGIKDPDELKRHILAVQKEAYAICPYPCIRMFSFAQLKISRMPAYKQMLKLGNERPGALFIDVGCCVGTDVRKAIADGFPLDQALGTDLHAKFWDVGHKLYKSTPETFPVPFLGGDATDPAFLAAAPIPTTPPTEPLPDLRSLTSLVPLVGRLSAIFTAAFFHLFDEATQLMLAKRLAALLSPEPGSLIFGAHVALSEKGPLHATFQSGGTPFTMFCHSPESWTELWEKQVFGEGKVKVDTILQELPPNALGMELTGNYTKSYLLTWSVTRI